MMKKKTFRMLAGVAALGAAVMLSACGNSAQSGEETTETEGKTLSYWVGMDSVLATRVQSYNEVAMYQQREKDTGIHIDFIHPAAGQWSEQFNLLVASGSLPDIIEYSWSNYVGGPQQAINDGIIIALDDYMEYAPNYQSVLTEGELADFYRKGATTDDGRYFGFLALNTGNYRIFGGPNIRRDWLNELGLEMPETIDDWTEVLTAFKEQKGATAPLTGIGLPQSFSGAFDVGYNWYVEDGQVQYGPLQSEYKEYLQTLNQWYESGLMDRDMASNQRTLVDAKITDGTAGALSVSYIGSYMGRYLTQMETEDPAYDLAAAPFPARAKGEVNRFVTEGGEPDVALGSTAVITTACEDPTAAVEWMDYWYSDAGYRMMNFGVEGESYTVEDGKYVYTDVILNNPDGLSISEALQMYCRATAPAPGLKQAPEYLEQYYEYPQQTEALKLWEANTESYRQTILPSLNSTPEEAETIASIKAELDTYVDEQRWNFVTGKESLDNYDQFVETLKNTFRVEEYQAILQAQYERYLAK